MYFMMYDFVILSFYSASQIAALFPVSFNLKPWQEEHKAHFQCVSVPPLRITQVITGFHDTKRKGQHKEECLFQFSEPVRA